MIVTAMVSRRIGGRKMSANTPREAAGALRDSRQIAGSSTLRRTHSVNSAGRIPTKNTPRQPHTGSTMAVTIAAAP